MEVFRLYTIVLNGLHVISKLFTYKSPLTSLTWKPSDTVLFAQDEYFYLHVSAVFEWMLSVNLELFELSYAVEFCFFSSFMLSNLLGKREEEKPLMMTMSWYDAARAQLKHISKDVLSKTSVKTVAGPWLEDQ